MSKVALSGNASGTGTFTIASPNSNVDRTVNLPDLAGTFLLDSTPQIQQKGVPILSASGNAGVSVSSSVATLVPYQIEDTDSANCYNNTASTVGGIPPYAFMPNVAGWYFISAQINSSVSAAGSVWSLIYKNGSAHAYGTYVPNSSQAPISIAAASVYLNGSTDYVQIYASQNSGSTLTMGATSAVYKFQATFVRAA